MSVRQHIAMSDWTMIKYVDYVQINDATQKEEEWYH